MAEAHLHLGIRQEQQYIMQLQNDFSGLCDVLDLYFYFQRSAKYPSLALSYHLGIFRVPLISC